MIPHETETQCRLRRAKEALEAAREKELVAIVAVNEARKSRERARERYNELFLLAEREEVAKLKSENRHCTK